MRTRIPAVVALLFLTAGCSALTDDRPPSDERAVDARVKSELHVDLSAGGASGEMTLTVRYDEPVNVTIPPSTRTDRYELGCPGE